MWHKEIKQGFQKHLTTHTHDKGEGEFGTKAKKSKNTPNKECEGVKELHGLELKLKWSI